MGSYSHLCVSASSHVEPLPSQSVALAMPSAVPRMPGAMSTQSGPADGTAGVAEKPGESTTWNKHRVDATSESKLVVKC